MLKPMVVESTWAEFREADLLWWVNRALHLFGWAICLEVEEGGSVARAYPARVRFRGFPTDVEEDGFIKLTKHLAENADLLEEHTKE